MEAAIGVAERQCSAQIKVVLARYCWLGLRHKAHRLFERLRLYRTTQRNCVLILLITSNHQFVIYGDRGIHGKVGSAFWQQVRDAMQAHFRAGQFAEGLCAGVETVGRQLAEYFPPAADTGGDELPNRIEYAT